MRKLIASLIFGTLLFAGCARHQAQPAESRPFESTEAMRTLFGNFDPIIKASLYRVPQGAVKDPNFADKDEIRARPFFTQETSENGIRKYYMLTWAKPAGQPFDCRGCAPLISAAVFVSGTNGWQLESVSRAALVFGDFGKPPAAELVQLGPDRHALLLRVTTSRAQTMTQEALLVPWKGGVQDAFQIIAADNNEDDCGGSYPCFGYRRDLRFVPGSNPSYDDIVLTLSGKDMAMKGPYDLHTVKGTERLRFRNGKYVEIEKTGQTVMAEKQ
jgi:hypothetical protein